MNYYRAITVLNAFASISIELSGSVSHAAMRTKAENLINDGVSRSDVERALFRVENLYNISAS